MERTFDQMMCMDRYWHIVVLEHTVATMTERHRVRQAVDRDFEVVDREFAVVDEMQRFVDA
jgi:thiamine biosynthesis lipoprotein ApbE